MFVVLEGEATFETRASGDDRTEITVSENEAIRFAPGEFQSGRNASDEPVVALALGAPRESEDVHLSRISVLDDRTIECPDCETNHMRISRAEAADFECPACDATFALDPE